MSEKETLLEETLCMIQNQAPHTQRELTPKQEILDPQRKGNFEEEETTSSVQCQYCNSRIIAGTSFCACGAKQQNLSKEHEEQTQTSVQQGIAYIQSLTQLGIRRQKLPGSTTDTAEHSKNTARPKITFNKAVTKGVKLGNTKERRMYSSIAGGWDMDSIYRERLRFETRTPRDCEIWDHNATTPDKSKDPKHQRTQEEREAFCGGCRTADVDKYGTCRSSTQEPRILRSFSLNPETCSR